MFNLVAFLFGVLHFVYNLSLNNQIICERRHPAPTAFRAIIKTFIYTLKREQLQTTPWGLSVTVPYETISVWRIRFGGGVFEADFTTSLTQE
ncbi:hypothetical protein CDAR_491321 [Caerostris darwini]|uniref:Secreted protein n=1 Tax=Caerostris darwini TaxID=1538125 RepID=A0AAV4X7P2_9ARAC|nr:hypothetical protein CDAR_491321 [Caerostris darwini]